MKASALAGRLGVSLSIATMLFVAGELAARLAEPGPFALVERSPYRPHASLPHVHAPGFRGRWTGTWYEIESHGLRGPELAPTFAPEEFRVLAVGDSCTFGAGVEERASWPRLLERRLGEVLAPGTRPLVANLGVNCYSAEHYLYRIRELGPLVKPQLVIVGYHLNDFPNPVLALDAIALGVSPRTLEPDALRASLKERSALFRLLQAHGFERNQERLFAAVAATPDDVRRAVLARTRRAFPREAERLGEIRAAVDALGARLLVFLFPHEGHATRDGFDGTPFEWLGGACAERGIPFLDPRGAFRRAARERPGERLFLLGDVYHPSAAGYAVLVGELLRVLRAQGWNAPG